MLKRSFTTLRPLAQQSPSSSSAPLLRRTKDPLLSSSQSQHFTLGPEAGSAHFIVRPPPSTLPPSLPIKPLSAEGGAAASEASLPPSRVRWTSSPPAERRQLSAEEVQSLQALRRSDPTYWTRAKLADKFSISRAAVGTLGWGDRAAERSRREVLQREKEEREARWGWKKGIAREERARRRTMW